MARLKFKRKQREPRIVKRHGRWVVDYTDRQGLRKRPSFSSKADALDHKKRVMKERMGLHEVAPVSDVTLMEAAKDYYRLISSNKESRKNEKTYFYNFRDFMMGELNKEMLSEIKKPDLISYQRHRRETVKASTVNREMATIKHFFATCMEWEMLAKNPCDRLKRLPQDHNPRKTWSEAETQRILDELPQAQREQLLVMAETGARNKEVRLMRWEQVDIQRNRIRLITHKGTGAARIRTVPLSPMLKVLMERVSDRALQAGQRRPGDLVFPSRDGLPFDRGALTLAVRRVRGRLGMEGITPYGLRHTIGTLIAKNNLEVARKILGHASLRTTQNYLHFDDEDMQAAVLEFSNVRKIRI